MRRILCSVVLLSSFVIPVSADETHKHQPMPGEKLGNVHFAISCDAAAQKEFDRGMAMLHSFWFEKANETFADLAKQHPECAMAHWGVAMSNYHPLWAPPNKQEFATGQSAVAEAQKARKVNAREKRYIAAISAFYADADKLDHRTRAKKYAEAMKTVHEADASDTEGAMLYALALDSVADPKDKTFANQRQCGEILEPIFQKQPQHPGLAHYLIHCYDNPVLAPKALNAAREYLKIAPSVPHALHMPSHIFTRLGLWDEAIASNSAAAEAGHRFEREMKMDALWGETIHALDYKHYALLQQGRVIEAQKIVDELKENPASTLNANQSSYGVANVLARHPIETGDWIAAADLPLKKSAVSDADAIIHLARAIGNGRLRNADAVAKEVDDLRAIEEQQKDAYWKGQVEIKRLEAEAWLAFARDENDKAIQLAKEAAAKEDATDKNPVTPGSLVPAHEMAGDLLLWLGQPAEALVEYQLSLKSTPNRFRSLAGAAKAAHRSGDKQSARRFFSELRQVAAKGDELPHLSGLQ
jgi:tetratricopeptide (TPR) repeat protein